MSRKSSKDFPSGSAFFSRFVLYLFSNCFIRRRCASKMGCAQPFLHFFLENQKKLCYCFSSLDSTFLLVEPGFLKSGILPKLAVSDLFGRFRNLYEKNLTYIFVNFFHSVCWLNYAGHLSNHLFVDWCWFSTWSHHVLWLLEFLQVHHGTCCNVFIMFMKAPIISRCPWTFSIFYKMSTLVS